MANAPIDQNRVKAKLAVLNTDSVQGTNLVVLKINESNNGLSINTTDTISFTMVPIDAQDANYTDCWLFTGSNGLTYPAVANADGELLIDT